MATIIKDKELTVVEKQTLTQAVLSIMNDTIAVNEPIFKGYSQYSTINDIAHDLIFKSGFNAIINHMHNSGVYTMKGVLLAKPNASIKGLLGNLLIGTEFTVVASGEISYAPAMINVDVEPTEWTKIGLFNAVETDGAFYLGQLVNVGELVEVEEETEQPKEKEVADVQPEEVVEIEEEIKEEELIEKE